MRRILTLGITLSLALSSGLSAQTVSSNVPVLPLYSEPGDTDAYLKGDLYLQRQVEPTLAVSTRNPDHLISFFNDYRAVDIADDEGIPGTLSIALRLQPTTTMLAKLIDQVLPRLMPPVAAAEAWVGMSRSYDGGLTWVGGMLPGGPFDLSPASQASPVFGREAATDPVAAAAPCGYVYVVFIAFTRGDESSLAVARYQDLNNDESGDTWTYDRTWLLETGNNATNGYFLDKPFLAVDVDRTGAGGACGHSVYVSYTTFNGLDKDGKFQSKLNFARSLDGGASWSKTKVNQPYGQSQGTALVVDPRQGWPTTTGGGTVYLTWRHFFSPDAMLLIKSTDYGTKWSKPVVLTQGTPLAKFDQPTLSTTAVPNPETDIAFRSNGFPTAAVSASGAVFAAWQERVNITPGSASFGRPDPAGSPRIVVVRSTDGGATWTDVDGQVGNRRAVDFADRDDPADPNLPAAGLGALPQPRASGPQVKPRLSFGGGRLLLAYTESRGLLGTGLGGAETIQPIDLSPSSGYASGYHRLFDFRAALLDPATGQLRSTTQVSRYPISAGANLADGEQAGEVAPINPPCAPDFAGDGLPPCVRQLNRANAPQSAAGTSPFMGDYPDASPIVPFVPLAGGAGWRWATEAGDVPFRGFHVVFPDNRHLVPPSEPETLLEYERYPYYDPPGTGLLSCVNPGSRNTDVLTARVGADVVLSSPTSFKQLDARRAFPFSLGNRTSVSRFYRLQITDGAADATFSPTGADIDQGDVEVFPYSSISQVVYVNPGAPGPIRVTVQEITGIGGDLVSGGQSGTVVFNADPNNPMVTTLPGVETQDPFVENPFVENPFVENPFVENPFVENPFVENPFVENPFVENSTVYDVIDTTWTVTAGGSNTAASYLALVNIDNAAQFVGHYAFQLIVYKNAGYAALSGCDATSAAEEQVLSNVVQNPFVENPFVENPFVENPFVENPFVENPFVENSTFTLAPSDQPSGFASIASLTGDGTLKAPRGTDQVKLRLRAYQLVPDEALGGFHYNPDPAQGGDSPALTVIALGCDTHDPTATCYTSNAPDLVAAGVDPTPLAARADSQIQFPAGGWTLRNQGSTTANAENRVLRHGVYLSADETVSLGLDDQPLDGDRLLGFQPSVGQSLAPEAEEAFSAASLAIPRDVPPGDYFLVLYVDDYREVSESDERNNTVAVAITVEPPNDPPVAEDATFTTPEDIPVSALLPATDPNADPLLFSVVTQGTLGTVTLDDPATGAFTYTPNANVSGTDSFTFKANDGIVDSNVATVTVEIMPVNDAPVAAPDSLTVGENSGATAVDVLANDVDVEGDPLVVTGVGPAAHGTTAIGPPVTYTPAPNFVGVDTFSYTISDGHGGTAVGTVTVTVVDLVPDYGFLGLLTPWTAEPLYTANAGSAIPLKWYYTDPATGVPVPSPNAQPEIRIKGPFDCAGDEGPNSVEEVLDPGSSGYQYDATLMRHQFNWDTNGEGPGCYNVRVFSWETSQIDGPFRIRLQ